MADIYRRCGCRRTDGGKYGPLPEYATSDAQRAKQLAKTCPKLLEDGKHGTWGFTLSGGIDPNTKKRRLVREMGFRNKQRAQQRKNEVAKLLDDGKYVRPTKLRYADYLETWLPRRATTGKGLRPTTVANYSRYIANDIAPSMLGSMRLSDIRPHDVEQFVADLQNAGRGASTIRLIAAVVQGSLKAARKSRLIETNPAAELDVPAVERKEFEPWSPEQVGQFLDVAGEHRLGVLFEVAMFTAMRRGELLGLRWEDIDFTRRVVTIRRNRTQAATIVENAPKTKSGRRVVDLADPAAAALIAWRIAQHAEADLWGELYTDSGYVFTDESGQPLKPQYATRLFDRLRLQAGLPKLTFHGQRHEAASLLIEGGADIEIVSKILGHRSAGFTSDRYSHLIGSAASKAVAAAAAAVPRKAGVRTMYTPEGGEALEQHGQASDSRMIPRI